MFKPVFQLPTTTDMLNKYEERFFVKNMHKALQEYPRKNVLPEYIRINEENLEEFWTYFNNLNDFEKSAIFKSIEYVNRPKNAISFVPCCTWWDHGLDVFYWKKKGGEDPW